MNASEHGSGFAAQQNRIVLCTVDSCSALWQCLVLAAIVKRNN